jgi:hypothetical protein
MNIFEYLMRIQKGENIPVKTPDCLACVNLSINGIYCHHWKKDLETIDGENYQICSGKKNFTQKKVDVVQLTPDEEVTEMRKRKCPKCGRPYQTEVYSVIGQDQKRKDGIRFFCCDGYNHKITLDIYSKINGGWRRDEK